ncbi:MAG: helix-turn-helix domain-containing protein [Candidatus Krumholzibacteriia bacterium]
MRLFKRKQTTPKSPPEVPAKTTGGAPKRRSVTPLEIKLLALDALQQGLTRGEVATIIGVAPVTVSGWQKKYDSEGLAGFYRRPPQIRRFERSLPNAHWQIDIFTFELKRMYKVYLVGIIDDHSRYNDPGQDRAILADGVTGASLRGGFRLVRRRVPAHSGDVGPHEDPRKPLDPACSGHSSLAGRAVLRKDPR